ncbi:MAG: MFS transporter [Candidatus Coatesbacteria bacterium]|nr:MFS transporter [Candidatus Coatesbacteria bacterium]
MTRRDLKSQLEPWREFTPEAKKILAGVFFASIGMGMFRIIFNLFLKELGYAEGVAGEILSARALGMALGALPAGVLSDILGRRRVMLGGVSLAAAAFTGRALLTTPIWMWLFAFLGGVFVSFYLISLQPALRENSSRRERNHLFSGGFIVTLAGSMGGSLVGGMLPGLFDSTGLAVNHLEALRYTLLCGAGLSLAGLIPLLLWKSPAPVRETARRDFRRSLKILWRPEVRRLVLRFGLVELLIGCGAGMVIPFFNLYFKNVYGLGEAAIGILFTATNAVMVLGGLLAPVLSARVGRIRAVVLCQLLSIPFLVYLGFFRWLPLAFAAYALRASLMNMSHPQLTAFAMDHLPREVRATSVAITRACWNLSWALVTPLAGGIMENWGYSYPFIVTIVFYLATAASIYFLFRRLPDKPETPLQRTPRS